jgi:hypothetical protein
MSKHHRHADSWGKTVTNPYDPQIGQAAQQTANTAAQSQQFSEQFYNDHIVPLLQQSVNQGQQSMDEQNTLFQAEEQQMKQQEDAYNSYVAPLQQLDYNEAQQQDQRYQQYGIPAEDNYYNAVANYSSPDEMEREATSALGDMRTAEASQQDGLMRNLATMGVSPNSPAAVSAMSDMAVQNAASEAGAMNTARNNARMMGLQLTSDAANFGRGGASNIINFGNASTGQGAAGSSSVLNAGQAAGTSANGAFGISQGMLASGNSAAAVPFQGYGQALQGYGNNLNAYAGLGSTAMNDQAEMNGAMWGGLGSMVGTAAGLAIHSDRRLKTDIREVGRLPSGLKIYKFKFKGSDAEHIGVLADEAEKIFPHAVSTDEHGFKMVDYGQLR